MVNEIVGTPEELGLKRNPNMPIGNGYWFCKGCKKYTFHDAFSRPNSGWSSCYEVCRECGKYYGPEHGH